MWVKLSFHLKSKLIINVVAVCSRRVNQIASQSNMSIISIDCWVFEFNYFPMKTSPPLLLRPCWWIQILILSSGVHKLGLCLSNPCFLGELLFHGSLTWLLGGIRIESWKLWDGASNFLAITYWFVMCDDQEKQQANAHSQSWCTVPIMIQASTPKFWWIEPKY